MSTNSLTPAMEEHRARLKYKRLNKLINDFRWSPEELRWLLKHNPDMPVELIRKINSILNPPDTLPGGVEPNES